MNHFISSLWLSLSFWFSAWCAVVASDGRCEAQELFVDGECSWTADEIAVDGKAN